MTERVESHMEEQQTGPASEQGFASPPAVPPIPIPEYIDGVSGRYLYFLERQAQAASALAQALREIARDRSPKTRMVGLAREALRDYEGAS